MRDYLTLEQFMKELQRGIDSGKLKLEFTVPVEWGASAVDFPHDEDQADITFGDTEYQRGYDAGYEAGYEAGYDDGFIAGGKAACDDD